MSDADDDEQMSALNTPAPSQGAAATAVSATPVERRVADLCAQFRKPPGDYDKLFAPAFLAQVPPDKLHQIFDYYFTQAGRCTQAKLTAADGALAGKFDLIFEQGYSVPATLAVGPTAPQLIEGMLLGVPVKLTTILAGIVDELRALPGETNLLVVKFDQNGMTPLIAHNAERELALGSAFKLYVLSELVRGERARAQVAGRDDAGCEVRLAAVGHVAVVARRRAGHAAHAGEFDDLAQR